MKKLNAIIEDVNSELSRKFIAREVVSMYDVRFLLQEKMREEYGYNHFYVSSEGNKIKFTHAGIEFKVKKRRASGYVKWNDPKMTYVKLELVYDTNNRMQCTVKEIDDSVEQRQIFLEDVKKQDEQNNLKEFEEMLEKHSMTRDEFRDMQRLYNKLSYDEQYKK